MPSLPARPLVRRLRDFGIPEVDGLGRHLRTRLPGRTREPKVFGIGAMRTGTTSLGCALEILGYRHTHRKRNALLGHIADGNLAPVYRWVERHESFEDWPWPLIYRELDARYPNSRYILTVRNDEQAWLRSIVRFSEWVGPTLGREMFFGHPMPTGHEDAYLARYRRHNQDVRDYFAGRPEKLLEVCWGRGDEWEKLCGFLGAPVPDRPFPRANSSDRMIRK